MVKTKLEKFELPRKLVNRNPNNQLDIGVAHAIITQFPTFMSRTTAKQLKELGIKAKPKPFDKIKVLKRPIADQPVVSIGAFTKADFPQQFNFKTRVVSCKQCKTLLYVMEKNDVKIDTFLCCFCAADQLLDEYWKDRDSRR